MLGIYDFYKSWYFNDGSNLARIFYVSEGVTSFTLKDVTLQNAYATTGSAIYFVDRMTNVEIAGTFSDNTQRQNGAIYFADGVSGNVVLDGDFTNNNAVSGNVGVLNFGTVYAGSNVVLKGNYRNNTCKCEMAVAYFPVIEEGATVVLEGTFSGNYNGGNPYGAASVAYFGYLNGNAILNGTFTNNRVPSSGGIAYVNSELNGNLILDGVFTNNNANNGGIISIAPIVNGNIILNGTFINNSASNVGGIINFANVINGDVNFTGTFTDNNASSGAVAYMNNKINGNVFVSGNFTNNTGNALISLKDAGTFDNVHSTIPSEDIGVRTSISATVPASMYEGNKLRIIAKLNGIYEALWTNDYKGTVINLTVNNKNYQAVLNESGYGEFIIDDLNTAGVYEVKVFYGGNETYLPCENLYNLTVLSSADHKSFTDLYEAINNNTDGVIYLDGTYIFDFVNDAHLQNGIGIYVNMVIDGQGKTVIDGAGLARIFNLNSDVSEFTLKNIIIKNAKAGNGAVIMCNAALDTLVLNGTFNNNYATGSGSVVYSGSTIGDCIVDGVYYNNTGSIISIFGGNAAIMGNFTENTADYGPVLRGSGFNGVLSGYFKDNHATNCGGVAHITQNCTIILNGTFIGNNATNYGGVFSTYRGMTYLEFSGIFENNSAGVAGGVGAIPMSGGAYYSEDILLTGDFNGNSAPDAAVLWTGERASINNILVENAAFTNNTAENGNILVLNNFNVGDIDNTDFIDNNAIESIIYTNNPINIGDNVKFENNIGGEISSTVLTSLTVTLSSSQIYDNRDVEAYVTLEGLKDYSNQKIKLYISDDYYQDVLLNDEGSANVTLPHLRKDVYVISAYYEGNNYYLASQDSKILKVIPSTDSYAFKMLNETINNNTDGVVYLDANYIFDPVADADLIEGIVIDRDIVIDGRGNTIDGASLSRIFYLTSDVKNFKIVNVTVQNAKAQSGAIIYSNTTLDTLVLNGTFTNNYAIDSGSVVYSSRITDSTLDGTYYKNHAGSNGGVINTAGTVNLIGNFTENYANSYGGVLSGSANAVLSGYFKDNYASSQSGGVAHTSLANANMILNGTFIGNRANNYGGVFSSYRGIANAELSGTFENNSAGVAGGVGAMPVSGGAYPSNNVLLTGDFTGNSAPNAAILWTGDRASVNSLVV